MRHSPAFGIATQVVGCEARHSRLCGELLNNMPGKLLGDPVSPRLASATYATEHSPTLDSRNFHPRAELAIDPVWNRRRPDVTALAAQVNDRPMSLALLEVINGQLGHLVTPEPTRKQDRQKSSVPFALEALPVRSLPERDAL